MRYRSPGSFNHPYIRVSFAAQSAQQERCTSTCIPYKNHTDKFYRTKAGNYAAWHLNTKVALEVSDDVHPRYGGDALANVYPTSILAVLDIMKQPL